MHQILPVLRQDSVQVLGIGYSVSETLHPTANQQNSKCWKRYHRKDKIHLLIFI